MPEHKYDFAPVMNRFRDRRNEVHPNGNKTNGKELNGNGAEKRPLFEILGRPEAIQGVRKVFKDAGYSSVIFKGTDLAYTTLVVIKEPEQAQLLSKLQERFGAKYVQILKPH